MCNAISATLACTRCFKNARFVVHGPRCGARAVGQLAGPVPLYAPDCVDHSWAYERSYLSATCSVWGILGLNRGVHPLVRLMRSFPRAYAPIWRFTSGTLTPPCPASVAWRHARCCRPVAARTRTPSRRGWCHRPSQLAYATIDPKDTPHGSCGAEIWLIKGG